MTDPIQEEKSGTAVTRLRMTTKAKETGKDLSPIPGTLREAQTGLETGLETSPENIGPVTGPGTRPKGTVLRTETLGPPTTRLKDRKVDLPEGTGPGRNLPTLLEEGLTGHSLETGTGTDIVL